MHASSRSSAPVWALPVARGGPIVVLLAILVLHALKPEYHPSWRFISEYAIGPWGWIMKLAFMAWAASCVALSLAVRPEVNTRRGRVGTALLLVIGAALVAAGLFPQDPVTAAPSEATTAGMIHAIASMVGIPGIPVAAVLITPSLKTDTSDARAVPAVLRASAHATWISLVLMVVYLGWAVPRAGGFNADVWAGWMNRLVVATYLTWQTLISVHLAQLAGRSTVPRGLLARWG